MKALLRWGKFNLVGAMGMAVQLASLALFNRWLAGHYICATALAIEITLLHNFAWHLHYTWRDREDGAARLRKLARFHLSNGLVSMVGNLILMRVLVYGAHLPVLPANGMAILCCSLINFFLGDVWVFARTATNAPRCGANLAPRSCLTAGVVLFIGCAVGHAQDSTPAPTFPAPVVTTPLPDAPKIQPAPSSNPSESYLYNAGAFCGIGLSNSTVANKPTAGCGAGITLVPFPIFLEFGVMAPQANRSAFTGYMSIDGPIPLAKTSSKYLPLAILGYSRLFETGHALDYGLALAMPRFSRKQDDSKSLRIELRDYCTFANPVQHNIMLRLGWMSEVED